ncbi:MAG: hypothetical protein C4320_09210, partial [Armatimonadota bacterium]
MSLEPNSYEGDFAWLTDELPNLREVPPMQLSNERLRDAILKTGLNDTHSTKVLPWWSWAWAPLAAAALVVVVLPRMQAPPAPVLHLRPETLAL